MIDQTTVIIIILFLVAVAIAYWIGHKSGAFKKEKYWLAELPSHRKDAILRSRAVLGGHFSEQLAPYLPNFKYLPTECKFMGEPIDFICFKGMDKKNINEVVFVEVKSGNAKLNRHEKNLKEVIDKKKVKWIEYRIPKELTKKGNVEEKIKEFVEDIVEDKGK